jgi:hypothetical protein
METPREAHELDDVALCLTHLDALDIDVLVLHNTLAERRFGISAACGNQSGNQGAHPIP